MTRTKFKVAIGDSPDHTVSYNKGDYDGNETQRDSRRGAPKIAAALVRPAKKVAQGDKKSRTDFQEDSPSTDAGDSEG